MHSNIWVHLTAFNPLQKITTYFYLHFTAPSMCKLILFQNEVWRAQTDYKRDGGLSICHRKAHRIWSARVASHDPLFDVCVCVCVCLQVLGTICTCAERVQNWVYNYSVRLPPMAVWALHVVSSRLRCIYFPEYTKTKRISNISQKCTCLHGVCVFATVHLPYIFVKFHCQKRRLDINWPHADLPPAVTNG